ncbi:MAG: hypothetical protein NZ561_12810 [Phycisphaerae bacterium]|nr:hypothetical protein [Phycisphaerae bacterium]MDW8262829.1 hypothetical protein [Phycisphaerales bacterium]
MAPRKTQFLAGALVILAGLCGCGVGTASRSVAPEVPQRQLWKTDAHAGVILRSGAYKIHSTVEDEEFNRKLLVVMEAALQQYRKLAPSVRPDPRPMECYVFANRRQWAEFTRQQTGEDAAIYLQINRGGYTIGDVFVAYYLGDHGTFAVAAHEGWHQFVSRHFQNRLPPFLEEGLATTFESITWSSSGEPRWTSARNVARAERLRKAIQTGSLWPLESLLAMHAGDVVSQPPDRIEAFYAQNWAFARFLREAEEGRYRLGLQRMIDDAVAGRLPAQSGRSDRPAGTFNPAGVRPLLEHYLGAELSQIDLAYQRFIRKIARDEPVPEHAR